MVEATFSAIKTLFAQHVAGFKGANTTLHGREVAAVWTIGELQDLLDEWLILWQHRPHEEPRDPHAPRRMLTPNERYAALVAISGYLPITLTGTDYLELLPVKWRAINDYGRIDYRTYDCAELGPLRRQHSGLTGKRGLWEVHYDPLSKDLHNGSYGDLGVIPNPRPSDRVSWVRWSGCWHNAPVFLLPQATLPTSCLGLFEPRLARSVNWAD